MIPNGFKASQNNKVQPLNLGGFVKLTFSLKIVTMHK